MTEREPRRFQGWHRELDGSRAVASTEGQIVEELKPFEPPVDFTDLTGVTYRLGGQSHDPRQPNTRFYQYFIPSHPAVDMPTPAGRTFKTFRESYIQDVLREQEKERRKFERGQS